MDEPTPKEPSPIRFDDDTPGMYDVVLIVDEEKFFCSKSILAKHSDYFQRMFFGGFLEKNMEEVTLSDPFDADEFRTFLELIYAVNRLDDYNIEGVLIMSHIWCAKIATQECLDFLMGSDSKRTNWDKFRLADMFNLFELKEHIISLVKTKSDLDELVSIKSDWDEKTKDLFWKRYQDSDVLLDNLKPYPPVRSENVYQPRRTPESPKRLKTIQFNDANEGMYDVVFVVKEDRFYCTKSSLAKHSTHFHSMFFGENPNNEKEIVLEEPSSKSVFQAFLETINAVKCLDDKNVGGVLRLAHVWKVPIAKEKCMAFLLSDKCKLSIKEKFQLDSMELKEKALSECKTSADLKSIAGDVDLLDEATTKLLLKKSFELPPNCPNCPPERQRNAPPVLHRAPPQRPIRIFHPDGARLGGVRLDRRFHLQNENRG